MRYSAYMPKNITTLGTVISLRPSGKNNSTATLFTQTEGIVYAVLYGGAKSKLKSLVSPWNTGTFYFSITNTGSYKISDFDVSRYRMTFRENLLKFWCASLAAEIIIKTKSAGSPSKCWALVNGFLDGLELCQNDQQCTAGLIRFLWRYLTLLGIAPEPSLCCFCGEKISNGAFYNPTENGFSCPYCAQHKNPLFINQNGIDYLHALSSLTPNEARQIPLKTESIPELKQLLYFLIENACGSQLETLKSGRGIL